MAAQDKTNEDKNATPEEVKEGEDKATEEAGEKPAEGEAPAEGAVAAPDKGKKKKLIIIGVFALLLIAAGGGVFFYLSKQKAVEAKKKAEQEEQQSKKEIVYYGLDEMIVNLNTEGKNVSFLKLKVTLEVEGQTNLTVVKTFTPKIKDAFQLYLREIRPSEMQGSMGAYRLKDELLLRINKVIYPAHVKDILIDDVLVQ
jgi:flagellar FliL protein